MKNYIIFDLETNGLDLKASAIMQITMLDVQGNILLNEYVYPYDNNIQGTEIHGIDKNILQKNNALSLTQMCLNVKNILRKYFDREDIYWIAYNNFGFDQLILENNYRISNIKIPTNWFFIDLFPLIKELYPTIKPNYKLKSVYEELIGANNTINYHSSLADTQCLLEIFNKVLINESKFQNYTRSLIRGNLIYSCPLTSLQGYHYKMKLERLNINNIGDLCDIYKKMNYDKELFYQFLKNQCNIYIDFYAKNIVKQIDMIKEMNL